MDDSRDGFYRRIFDDSPAAILVVNPDFVITDANLAAERMFNRDLAHLRGFQLRRFVAHSDQAAFVGIRSDIEDQAGYVTRPLLLRLPDQTEYEVSVTAAVFRNEKREPEFILLTLLERGTGISEDML